MCIFMCVVNVRICLCLPVRKCTFVIILYCTVAYVTLYESSIANGIRKALMAHQKISELDAKLRLLTTTKVLNWLCVCVCVCICVCLPACLPVWLSLSSSLSLLTYLPTDLFVSLLPLCHTMSIKFSSSSRHHCSLY